MAQTEGLPDRAELQNIVLELSCVGTCLVALWLCFSEAGDLNELEYALFDMLTIPFGISVSKECALILVSCGMW